MNRFGSNSFENENDQFAENQRIGRQLAENNPRPWNETYDPDRTYQSRHHSHPNYMPDHPVGSRRGYQSRNTNWNDQPSFYAGSHHEYPANDPAWRHHDDQIWTERNAYKDSDYRYRSGHRNYWHEDYDDKYETDYPRHSRHPESFFGHVGEGIREGWNNLTHRQHTPERGSRYEERSPESNYRNEPRHWPNTSNYPGDVRRQKNVRSEERWEDERRRQDYKQRSRQQDPDWHNAGPDHHDEDFFDPRNFRL